MSRRSAGGRPGPAPSAPPTARWRRARCAMRRRDRPASRCAGSPASNLGTGTLTMVSRWCGEQAAHLVEAGRVGVVEDDHVQTSSSLATTSRSSRRARRAPPCGRHRGTSRLRRPRSVSPPVTSTSTGHDLLVFDAEPRPWPFTSAFASANLVSMAVSQASATGPVELRCLGSQRVMASTPANVSGQ